MAIQYGSTEQAFEAIHSSLNDLMAPPKGNKVTKIEFTWTASAQVETLSAFDGAALLFTLTFTWNEDGTLSSVTRA